MKRLGKKILAILAALAMVVSMLPQSGVAYAAGEEQNYVIYPTPHEMTYGEGSYELKSVNAIYEEGIDSATKARLEEAMALKGISVSESQTAVSDKLNVYVGIYGSNGAVDTYASNAPEYAEAATLFAKTDSYYLASSDGTIVVLGKDTDACFYGLTSLYHIIAQMESNTIRNFTIADYADIVSRGFIEGYYGNPWSTEDRCNLMEWGGYYKLNSYFYAPKDDPKHNSNWRELYTEEEIETKIEPLAEAGNASKCRFVYALHPYMYNAISYSSEEAYQADLAVMQAKFAQVIEAGVRQIAILADDASNVGSANYIRTLEDMTAWLKEMQKTYPDLKLTLPFCTQEYMSNGQSYYSQFPENVQIVMTGGKVWGEVSNNFTNTFTNNVGRGPYMWINWPCTDNSKQHLIMGGYTTFLQAGVDPSKIQGIVLNPMQQSEPSKVAIFGNAAYSWNIWETNEEADAAWEASFSFVDHNSAVPNAASNALRELSKHMINQNMDSRVTKLEESVELKPLINAFKTKLEAGTATAADTDELIAEFEVLQQAAKTYRAEAGNAATRDQIVYWLNCWDDTTEAIISYLNAVKAIANGEDDTIIWDYYSKGQASFESSKTYGFHYVDHTEYAEVGVQHIVPLMETLDEVLGEKAAAIVDPTIKPEEKIYGTPVYNEENMGIETGSLGMYTDGDKSQYVGFGYTDGGDYTVKDAWVGLEFVKTESISSVKVTQGTGDHIDNGTLQYLNEADEWVTIGTYTGIGQVFEERFDAVQAKAIRLVNDAQKTIWWRIYEFEVNVPETVEEIELSAFDSGTKVWSGSLTNVIDGDTSTSLWYAVNGAVGQYIGVDLGTSVNIGKVQFVQDSGDHWPNYDLEYSLDGTNYTTFNSYEESTLDIDLSSANIEARYIRFKCTQSSTVWTKIYEISVSQRAVDLVYTNNAAAKAIESDVKTAVAQIPGTHEVTLAKGEYIGLDLRRIKDLASIAVSEVPAALTLEVSKNQLDWTTATAGEVTEDARFVRLINKTDEAVTFTLSQFEVTSNELAAPSLLDSNIGFDSAYGYEDCRENGAAFDGDVDTTTIFADFVSEGEYILYDLGQKRVISKLEIYCTDSATNYIRDAVISVSADLENWTDVITIGDGVENVNQASVTCINSDAGYSQTTSAYPNRVSIEGEIEPTTARYIRILMTAANNDRFATFNELAINDGEYVSTTNDPTFDASHIEVQGFEPQKMFDGDLTTAYKANTEEAGYVQYTLSENMNVNRINIVQKGVVTNAKVSLYVEDNGVRKWVDAGTLSKSLNQIYCDYDLVLEIRIEWEAGKVPTITEIVRFYEENVVRTGFEAYVADLDVNEADYTAVTYAVYEEKLAAANAALENASSSDAVLQAAWDELKAAYAGLVKKGDKALIQTELDKVAVLEEADYTEATWNALQAAAAAANEAMKAELSEAEVAAVVESVQKAQAALVTRVSVSKDILAKYILDNELETLDTTAYLTKTAVPFTTALKDAKAVLADEDATVADAEAALKALQDARAGLVLKATAAEVAALKELADSYKEADYTANSWAECADVLAEVYAAVEANESTSEEVAALQETLGNAAKDLVLRGDVTDVITILEAIANLTEEELANFTDESIEALAKAAMEVYEALDNPNLTEEDVAELVEKLLDAINGLEEKPEDTNPGEDPGQNPGEEPGDDTKPSSPATGDSSVVFVWFAVMALSLAAAFAGKRRLHK